MSKSCVQTTLLLLLFCFSCQASFLKAQSKWRIRNRIQTTYEYDSNIRESPVSPIEDSSVRLLFHSRATRNTSRARLLLGYRGGFQTYFQHPIENKLVNELDAQGGIRFGMWTAGLRLSGRLKLYLNDQLDYGTGSAQFFIQLPPLLKLNTEVSVRGTDVNYQNFSGFDYSIGEVRWRLARKLSGRVTGAFDLAARRIRYRRFISREETEGMTQVLELNLTDKNYLLQAQFSYSRNLLLNLTYVFEHNDSRVPEYAFDKHQVTLVFGLPVVAEFWLRAYAALQLKRYEADDQLISPIDIDTEREESNFVVLDLSRDLTASLTALVRLALYNNESIARGFFYHKTLISAGFDYRF